MIGILLGIMNIMVGLILLYEVTESKRTRGLAYSNPYRVFVGWDTLGMTIIVVLLDIAYFIAP